jgi:signal transduction histidine kinase
MFAVTLLVPAVVAVAVSWPKALAIVAVTAASAVAGLLLTLRRPRNPIGWLLSANGLLLAVDLSVMFLNEDAVDAGPPFPAWLPWTATLELAAWGLLFAPLTAVVALFPDGRLPSRRWRPYALGWLAAPVAILLAHLFSAAELEAPYQAVEPPLPVLSAAVTGAVVWPAIPVLLAGLIAAVAAARGRLRRASGGERTQMLWLAYAALTLPLTVVLCLLGALLGSEAPLLISFLVMLVAIPAAVGIAVLRHQLFDIELVLDRTLVYGALTLAVVAVYAGVVVGLGSLVGSEGAAGLLAAGLVAVGINPARGRLQRRVNRFVYGARSDPYRALTRLTERLQLTLAPAEVIGAIVESVAEALRLPYVAVELDRGGVTEIAAAHGTATGEPDLRIPLVYQGEAIARLAIQMPPGRRVDPADRRLLDELARPAGVAVHAVRLTADLQRSRERLVSAREEERRRLRRDLHDGLGPMLAASVLQIDAARRSVAADPRRAEALLDDLRDQTRASIADVRRLVDELRPPALDELGLVQALREQAMRLGRDRDRWGSVEAPERMPSLPAAVEVAAYRIATEAMTNVARHAGARHCRVHLTLNGGLLLEVADDGTGVPAPNGRGVGLRSMQERAAELGGTCTVTARAGGGTLVRAQLPIGAP